MIAVRNMLRSAAPGMTQPPRTSAAIRSRGAWNSDFSVTGVPVASGSISLSCAQRDPGPPRDHLPHLVGQVLRRLGRRPRRTHHHAALGIAVDENAVDEMSRAAVAAFVIFEIPVKGPGACAGRFLVGQNLHQ